MKPSEYQEEWLSAYLDDELTAEQRQIVESRLAADAAAQSILDDLKRVRKLVSELVPWSGQNLQVSIPPPGSAVGENWDASSPALEGVSNALHAADAPGETENDVFGSSPTALTASRRSALQRRWRGTWAVSAASILLLVGIGSTLWWRWDAQNLAFNAASSPTSRAVQGLPVESFARSLPAASANSSSKRADSELKSEVDRLSDLQALPSSDLLQTQSSEGPAAKTFDVRTLQDPTAAASRAPQDMAPASRAGGSPSPASETNSAALPAAPVIDGTSFATRGSQPGANSRNKNSLGWFNFGADKELPGNDSAGEVARIQIARSSAWSEQEVEMAFAETMSGLGVQGITPSDVTGTDRRGMAGETEKLSKDQSSVPTQSLLLVSIEPTLANSTQFFDELIGTNQLTPVAPTHIQVPRLLTEGRLQAGEGRGEATTSANTPTATGTLAETKLAEKPAENAEFPAQQSSVPAIPDAILLFLTESAAEEVLGHLQQKGQVTSQIWRVASEQPTVAESSRSALADASSVRSSGQLVDSQSSAVELRVGAEAASKQQANTIGSSALNSPSATTLKTDRPLMDKMERKVILLLSSPPR